MENAAVLPMQAITELAKEHWQNKNLDALKSLLEENPDQVIIAYYIGLIHHDRGDTKKAIKFWQQALRIDEDHFPSLKALAIVWKEEEPAAAAECLEQIEELGKAELADFLLLGDLYFKAELFDAAHHAYICATEVDPDSGEPYLRLAILHVKWGQHSLEQANSRNKKKFDLEDLLATK